VSAGAGSAAATAAGAVLPRWRRGLRDTARLYGAFVRLAFLKLLAFRLRYYTGVVTYTIFVAGNFYLYRALFASRPGAGGDPAAAVVGGLTLSQMVGYIVVSWAGRSFTFNNIDRTLAHQVVRGDVVFLLTRPFHVQTVMLSEALGEAAFRLLLFTAPILAVTGPLFHLPGPPQPSLLPWTLLSFALAWLVNTQISFLVGCLAFHLKNIQGVIRAKMVLMELLTGVLVPLTFFPGPARRLLELLPFQAVSYVPVTVYLGLRPGSALPRALLVQAGWAAALLLAGRWLWNRSLRAVTAQGG